MLRIHVRIAHISYRNLSEVKKDYIETGKVRFTYREVYFDKYGLWASMIARCAGPENSLA